MVVVSAHGWKGLLGRDGQNVVSLNISERIKKIPQQIVGHVWKVFPSSSTIHLLPEYAAILMGLAHMNGQSLKELHL